MSADLNKQICGLRRLGVGPREIARRLNTTSGVVAGHLHRAGMTETGKGRPGPTAAFRACVISTAKATSNAEAARQWHVTRSAVRNWIRWTEA